MQSRPLAPESWAAELDSFSRQHEGWLVSIKSQSADGETAIEAHEVPLQGVSAVSRHPHDVAVSVGDADHLSTHDVHDVIAMRLELTDDRAERALIMDARDGSTTTVEFRSPVRVEEVDGLPASPRP